MRLRTHPGFAIVLKDGWLFSIDWESAIACRRANIKEKATEFTKKRVMRGGCAGVKSDHGKDYPAPNAQNRVFAVIVTSVKTRTGSVKTSDSFEQQFGTGVKTNVTHNA